MVQYIDQQGDLQLSAASSERINIQTLSYRDDIICYGAAVCQRLVQHGDARGMCASIIYDYQTVR